MIPAHDAAYWVKHLELQPHPEGGWYREVYRAEEEIPHHALHPRFKGKRSYSTSIYFLLAEGNISAFHRIQSDELWHFYAGNTVKVFVIHPGGELEVILLGSDPEKGERFQAAVPAGCWFGSLVEKGYGLTGCTVAPGFDFEDFEMAGREELLAAYPQHTEVILRLTR